MMANDHNIVLSPAAGLPAPPFRAFKLVQFDMQAKTFWMCGDAAEAQRRLGPAVPGYSFRHIYERTASVD